MPPSLEEAPEDPNLPPVILRDDAEVPIVPAPGRVDQDPDGDLILDSLPVLEPNLRDVLTLRLFLDGIPVLTFEPPVPGGTRRVLRTVLDLPCALRLPDSPMQLVGVVSDRGFDGPGRETPAEAGTSSVEWVLDCGPP